VVRGEWIQALLVRSALITIVTVTTAVHGSRMLDKSEAYVVLYSVLAVFTVIAVLASDTLPFKVRAHSTRAQSHPRTHEQ
jgi:purine-cytosine permease-like protein